MLELGRYVHNDRILLVDNIQVTQRTTSPPTPFPTFSSTEPKVSGPTNKPTRSTYAPSITNFVSCPPVGSDPVALDNGPVLLQIMDSSLCTLTRSATSPDGNVIHTPIARSYDGNAWEQAAGEIADTLFDGPILCYDRGCQINLPEAEVGSQYVLSSSSYSLSDRDKYARFLETASFGITEEQLNDFESSPKSAESKIASWIQNQMNESKTPMTSHREFWRRGVKNRVSKTRNGFKNMFSFESQISLSNLLFQMLLKCSFLLQLPWLQQIIHVILIPDGGRSVLSAMIIFGQWRKGFGY